MALWHCRQHEFYARAQVFVLFILATQRFLYTADVSWCFLLQGGDLLDGLLLIASWHVVLVISYVKREVVVSMHEVYKRAIEFELAQKRACRGQNLQQDENMDTSSEGAAGEKEWNMSASFMDLLSPLHVLGAGAMDWAYTPYRFHRNG